MTLSRQLFALVVLMFLLAFIGTFIINLQNTRQYLLDQLRSHAEDVSTSLGLSLSPPVAANDQALVERMVDAIFDRGYYREIEVVSTGGRVLVVRRLRVVAPGVPDWFVRLLPLDTPRGKAFIMSGWKQGGEVSVTSHPGYAYAKLWRIAVDTFWWSLGSFAAVFLVTLVILRALLKPLVAVEAQAHAIMERRFARVTELPRARELRRVVSAMNQMSGKVEEMLDEQTRVAERMRRQAFSDPTTGLGNRRSLLARLEHLASEHGEESFGALLLLQARGLEAIRERHGFAARDELLSEIAERVTSQVTGQRVHAARLSSDEFAVLVPGLVAEEVGPLCERLQAALAALRSGARQGLELPVGAACYAPGETAPQILARADLALQRAAQNLPALWHVDAGDAAGRGFAVQGATRWRELLEAVVAERRVELWLQPVKDAALERLLHLEVLARIRGDDGEPIPAGVFTPLVERFGLAQAFDRVVVELTLDHLGAATAERVKHAVNLSTESLRDPGFAQWLCDTLRKRAPAARRLCFECPDHVTQVALQPARELSDALRALGAGFALDHFGTTPAAFHHLRSLRLEHVKVDGSFVVNLEGDRDDQFLVQTFAQITHGLDLLLVAEFVETEAQLALLRELGADGVQGYLVGRPRPPG